MGPVAVGVGASAPILPLFTGGEPPDRLSFVMKSRLEVPKPVRDSGRAEKAAVREYTCRLAPHLRRNLSCWQHLQEPHALRRMESLQESSLNERYRL